MSMSRKVGAVLCVLALIVVYLLALTSTWDRPVAGLAGMQDDLADRAKTVVETRGETPQAAITVRGRDVRIELPDQVAESFDRDGLVRDLQGLDGVRNVEVVGDPTIPVSQDDAPAPAPTEAPADEPTVAPAPDPTAGPAAEPTAVPTTAPVPGLDEIVAAADLSGVAFTPGTAQLTDADLAVLDQVAGQLIGQTGGPIEVQAHTDNVGDPDVNLLLSQDRADAVVAYLTSQGVDGALLSPRGFGASQPIADNSTEQGRADNQRVVFVVEGN